MQSVYGYSHKKANLYLTIPYVTSGVLTPFVGFAVDRMGYRCHLLMISAVLLSGIHYVFMEGFQNEPLNAVCLFLLGVAYSIFCGVVWPSFAVVSDPKTLGTAYGIGVAGYNACLGTFFIVVGVLAKEEDIEDGDSADLSSRMMGHRYKDVQYFMLSMATLSIFTVLLLWRCDMQMGGDLKRPTIQPKSVRALQEYFNLDEKRLDNDSSIGLANAAILSFRIVVGHL